ncbi:MAG: DUF5683 domain-containing protein [Bacteroidota bacterium]
MKLTLSICLLALIGCYSQAQIKPTTTDTTEVVEELIIDNKAEVEIEEIETYADRFVPRKASLYAAIVPGLGQIYNKKYWKLPIVYGGFIALGFTIDFWQDQNKVHRQELFDLLENDPSGTSPRGLNVARLRTLESDTRRDRDYFIILTGLFYLLTIADAHIDAHLKEFDLNPQLKVSIEPMLEQPQFADYNAGISLKFKF